MRRKNWKKSCGKRGGADDDVMAAPGATIEYRH